MNNLFKNISASTTRWLRGFFKRKGQNPSKDIWFSPRMVLVGLLLACLAHYGSPQIAEHSIKLFVSAMKLDFLSFIMYVFIAVLIFYLQACISANKRLSIKGLLSRILYVICKLFAYASRSIASLMAGLGIFCIFHVDAYSADLIVSSIFTAVFLGLSTISAKFERVFHMDASPTN